MSDLLPNQKESGKLIKSAACYLRGYLCYKDVHENGMFFIRAWIFPGFWELGSFSRAGFLLCERMAQSLAGKPC